MKRFVVVLTVWAMALAGVLASVVFPSAASAATVPTKAGAYHALTPARMLDTRASTPVPAFGTRTLKVTSRLGVPAAVSAVVLNVTVAESAKAGFVTVFGGLTRPLASNINFKAGQTVPNLVVSRVDAGGNVKLYNGSAGNVRLVVDVSGYYRSGAPTDAGAFGSLNPTRLLDTRVANGAPKGAVAAGGKVDLRVTNRGGVPLGATSVVLNVTATAPTQAGSITVVAAGTAKPLASNLNFVAGQTVANLVIAPVSASGFVTLFNSSSGSTQLVADVSGFHMGTPPNFAGTYGSVVPERLLDTRIAKGTTQGPVAANSAVDLKVTGGVIPTNVSAVVLNVTVANPTTAGVVTVFETSKVKPVVSNLNFMAGQKPVANLVIAPVSSLDGRVTLHTTGGTELIADVMGYYLDTDFTDPGPEAVTTTTTLAVSPTSGEAPANPTLTATVTGADAAGTVEFFNGTTTLGTSPVAGGVATKALSAIGVGSYSYTAVFTPTDAAAFTPSSSTAIAYVVTAAPVPAPTASFTTSVASGTAPLLVAMTDTSIGAPTSWAWNFGNGTTSTVQNPSVTYAAAGPYVVTLIATNASGASAAVTQTITVAAPVPAPTASFTASPTAGAFPLAVTMTDTSIGSPTSWAWSFGNGTTSTVQNPSVTYAADGTFTVTLIASNAGGASAAVTKTISVGPPTGAVLSINESTGATASASANGFEPDFSVTGTHAGPGQTIVSGSLNYGDGTTEPFTGDPADWNFFHSYAVAGEMTVTLQVTDSDGNTASDVVTLTVYPAPTATLTESGGPARPGEPVTFALASDTPDGTAFTDYDVSYDNGENWVLVDGVPPETLTHTFIAEGTYTVLFTAYNDADGFAEASTQVVVEIAPDVTAPAPVTGLTATAAGTTSIALAWTNPADTDFTGVTIRRSLPGAAAPATVFDGISVDVPESATRTSFTDTGLAPSKVATTYSYAVFAHDAAGNHAVADTESATTPADTTPPGRVTGLNATAIMAHSLALTWNNPLGDYAGVMIRRNVGPNPPLTIFTGNLVTDTASPTTTTFTDTGLTPGTQYTYAAFAYDAAGNWATTTSTKSATTIAAPTAVLSIDESTGDTASTSVNDFGPTFDVAGSSAVLGQTIVSGSLNYGDGTTQPFTGDPATWEASHVYTVDGIFTVTWQVTDSAGGTASDVVTLTVHPAPTATITESGGPALAGAPVTFALAAGTPVGTAFTEYDVSYDNGENWETVDGVPPAGLTHTFAAAGSYTVVVVVYNDAHGLVRVSTDVTVG